MAKVAPNAPTYKVLSDLGYSSNLSPVPCDVLALIAETMSFRFTLPHPWKLEFFLFS